MSCPEDRGEDDAEHESVSSQRDSDHDPELEHNEEGASFGHFNAHDHRSSSDNISGSPGSQSYSSSSACARRGKIVELLQETSSDRNTGDQPSNWIIRPEFYAEDVAMSQEIDEEPRNDANTDCRDSIMPVQACDEREGEGAAGGGDNEDDDDDDDDDDDYEYDEAEIEAANRELNAIWTRFRGDYHGREQQAQRAQAHYEIERMRRRLQSNFSEGSEEDRADRDRQLYALDQIEAMLRNNIFDDLDDNDDEGEMDAESEAESIGIDINEYEALGQIARYNDSSSDEETRQDEGVNYDIMLPVNHSYLGDNLEESQGRQVLEENSEVDLLLFNIETVLFPGQVLPITTSGLNPRIGSTLNQCVTTGSKIIGIIYAPQVNSIGTVAEIRNFSIGNGELKLIIEGSQRFMLIGPPFDTAIRARVRILPEIVLGPSYPRISNSFSRLCLFKPQNLNNPSHQRTHCPYSVISRLPPWVHQRYDARFLTIRLLKQINDWCSISDLTGKHPNDFSYWLSSMLPINDLDRVEALGLGCAEARLLWLVELLEKCKHFVCVNCENKICCKEDVFAMSRSGPQCSFVNPGGYIHDTLTVRTTCGLFQDSDWVDEFTWFPGYKWRIAHCTNCSHHIGWCYKHIDSETRPKRFFGLSRNNVRLKRLTEDA